MYLSLSVFLRQELSADGDSLERSDGERELYALYELARAVHYLVRAFVRRAPLAAAKPFRLPAERPKGYTL